MSTPYEIAAAHRGHKHLHKSPQFHEKIGRLYLYRIWEGNSTQDHEVLLQFTPSFVIIYKTNDKTIYFGFLSTIVGDIYSYDISRQGSPALGGITIERDGMEFDRDIKLLNVDPLNTHNINLNTKSYRMAYFGNDD